MSASRLIPEGGESSPIFQDDNIEQFYTPPQSPAFPGQYFNMGDLEILSRQPAPASSLRAPPPTPITDAFPPSSITEAQPDSEEAIQFWRSDVYKATINFPPSELPENARNGWYRCLSTSPNGELDALFGPAPAIPFTWAPTTQSDDDVPSDIPKIGTGPKYIWCSDKSILRFILRLPQGSESQVHDEAKNKDSPRFQQLL